jgi:GNAT superfamily N-acetyltransferase
MEYVPVIMVRPHLRGIPQHPLPNGYSVRLFHDGDEKTWLRIWKAAETFRHVTAETFRHGFAGDLAGLRRRCCFLLDPDGREAGTITAWYDRKYRRRHWGRIHYVAVAPGHQGEGLCKPMMTVAMNRLRALGHRRAMLATQTPRLRAIKVYLDFGFVPDMTFLRAKEAWRLVRRELRHPVLNDL